MRRRCSLKLKILKCISLLKISGQDAIVADLAKLHGDMEQKNPAGHGERSRLTLLLKFAGAQDSDHPFFRLRKYGCTLFAVPDCPVTPLDYAVLATCNKK